MSARPARTSYVQIDGRLVEKVPVEGERFHLVMPDTPEYRSPIDNRIVSGRVQRREDLKRNGCRPYEKGEREAAIRTREQRNDRLLASMIDTVRWVGA